MANQTTIIQWNCHSLKNKKSDLIYFVNKYEPVAFALSETWLKPGYSFTFKGYRTVREDRPDGYGGVAIMIREPISFSQITLPQHNVDFSIVAINIFNISLVSVYIPRPSSIIFNELEQILTTLPRPYLILGDFNSHHRSWGCSESNSFGDELLEIVDSLNLCILNTGSPTRRTSPNQVISAVDLSICTPNLASTLSWSSLQSSFGSDHFPILISCPFHKPPIHKSQSHLKHRLPDSNSRLWEEYKTRVENKISSLVTLSTANESSCAESLAQVLLSAADETFPAKGNSCTKIPSPPWWDSECSNAVKNRKQAEKAYSRNMTQENYNNLSLIIKSTRKLFKQKKFDSWKSFCSSISPYTHPSLVWRNIKRFRSAFSNKFGSCLPVSLTNDFLDKLAPPWVPNVFIESQMSMSNLVGDDCFLESPFSSYELQGVLENISDSAPGVDGIPYSFLANASDNALGYYLSLINHLFMTGNNVPKSWKHQVVLPFLKPEKNPSDVNSYRPIVLSSVLIKLAEHLIKNRLEWFIENRKLLSDSQYGFRKGRCTLDCTSVFMTDIRLALSDNQSVVAAFLDINSAYDNVNLNILQNKLHSLKIPSKLNNFIMNTLFDRSISICLTDNPISRVVNRGLPQGSVLSPILYNIYTYDLEASFNNPVSILQYADDLLIYLSNHSIQNSCLALSLALLDLKSWMDQNGLDLSLSKSAVVLFTRKKSPQPLTVFYNNNPLPVKKEFKYLGVIFDSKLTGGPHCEYVSAKCEKHLNILRCLRGVWWGAHPQSLKLVYNAIIRSILDYSTFILEPCNKSAIEKFDRIQAKALRLITGAMKSSPINALQVECVEPPLSLRRQFLADKFLFRIMQNSNHPLILKLEKLTNLTHQSTYWSHKTIPCLVQSFLKFKSLSSPTHQSSRLPLFNFDYRSLILSPKISYDSVSRDEFNVKLSFIHLIEQNYSNYHHLYTDASKHSPTMCVGVGVFHAQFNIVQKIKLPPETSVFTGECYGIYKAIDYILMMRLQNSVVFSDSKSALQCISKFPFKSKFYFPLIFEIRNLLWKCLTLGLSIKFIWIPSHCGILGNETADRLANEAVQCGDIFPFHNYCHDLSNLPKRYLQESWNNFWETSKQQKGKFYANIQPHIPLKPWFFKYRFGKMETSILIRLRLGHVCSPSHFARLNILRDASCECGADFGDTNHILFSCPLLDRSTFINDLIRLQVPFPTSAVLLLYSCNPFIYKCMTSFITVNNIKL